MTNDAFRYRDRSLLEIVASSTGPHDICDSFCYVVGYLEAEIKHAQRYLFESADPDDQELHKRYEARLAQLGAAWEAFVAATPAFANTPTKEAGKMAQFNGMGKEAKARALAAESELERTDTWPYAKKKKR